MSTGAVRLSEAAEIGAVLVRCIKDASPLADAETVGSVRRCRPIVGDVEVLVSGTTDKQVAACLLAIGAVPGPPNKAGHRAPWGPRYFRALLPRPRDGGFRVQLDVFVCLPPAEYGVLRLIRTGSAAFSQAVVTRLHRYGLESNGGRIIRWSDSTVMPAPTEEAVLRYARLPWIPPSEREMDNPRTADAFRKEAAPWECPDSPVLVRLDGTSREFYVPAELIRPRLCPRCGQVHPTGRPC
jgi:DNA polymerase/3'-5' exonuclease PolX